MARLANWLLALCFLASFVGRADAVLIPPPGGAGSGTTVQSATSVTSYTVQATDCGTIKPFTAPTTVNITLPGSLPTGCSFTETQLGAGTLVNYGGPGVTIASLYNATFSKNASLTFLVASNPTNLTATYITTNTGRYYSPSGTVMPTLPTLLQTPAYSFYVNSSTGSDSNPGTQAQPWQTLANVASPSSPFQPGTALYLQGSFSGCTTLAAGTNVSSSTTMLAGLYVLPYGSGYTITATNTSPCAGGTQPNGQGPKSAVLKIDGVNGVFVEGGNFVCNNTSTQYGIVVQNSLASAGINGVTISGNTVSGCELYTLAPGANEDYAAEIAVLSKTLSNCYNVNNVLIAGNSVSGTAATNYDDMGINVNGCFQNGVTNVTIINNSILNIGGRATGAYPGATGNGILTNGTQYVNDGYNTVSYIGANSTTCGGPGGNWTYNSDNVWIHHNEVNHVQPYPLAPPNNSACDWLAYDLDGCVTNSVVSYNHSDKNWGNAQEFYMDSYPASGICPNPTWGNNAIHHNISEGDNVGNSTNYSFYHDPALGILSIAGGNGNTPASTYFYNNTFVITDTTNRSSCWGFYAAPVSGQYINNICYKDATQQYVGIDGGGNAFPSSVVIDYNDYYFPNTTAGNFQVYSYPNNYYSWAAWQQGTGNDTHSILTNPNFSGTPALAACTITPNVGPGTCPTALNLGSGSPALGAGANLASSLYSIWYTTVSTDYYGNNIPGTSGYNLGAYGGPL